MFGGIALQYIGFIGRQYFKVLRQEQNQPGIVQIQRGKAVADNVVAVFQVFTQCVPCGIKIAVTDLAAALGRIDRQVVQFVEGRVFEVQRQAHPAVVFAAFQCVCVRDEVFVGELFRQKGNDGK